jgi:hypothetical protein
MPDEPQAIRAIDWKSAFPFTLIFRSFRVAIHPSKLVLALLALVLIYFGGRIMDAVWPAQHRAVPGELAIYITTRDEPDASEEFRARRQRERDQIIQNQNRELELIGKTSGGLGDIKDHILNQRGQDVEAAKKAFDSTNKTPEDQKARDDAIAGIYRRAEARWEAAQAYNGEGLFKTFYALQTGIARRAVEQAGAGEWLGPGGVVENVIAFLTVGPGWAIRHHIVYFTIFGVYSLFIWAVFGGAIARIAAVHVARDEKISFRQALDFSTAKFLSFISAPIIPLLIILVVGLFVALGGALLNIPIFGPLAVGGLYFLALIAGFIMTLVLLGLLGGFNLMYPTIAVEGSDSFDAISRSFSYLFARPWRMAFYTIVAAVYGTICYVFMRYFIIMILRITHLFTGMAVFSDAYSTEPLWPVMWPSPTAMHFTYSLNELTLGAFEYIGAFLVAFWVYLVMAMLGAFAISFYFSANTIIYVLMRHEVDATELDDVYLEQTEEDFGDSAAAPVTAPPAGDGGAAQVANP